METYEKEADAIIKKSTLHKNDLIPDTYKYKLEKTLECLPEKETVGQIIEDIKIVRNKGRMEFSAIASVAAAVLLICAASVLLLKKPDPVQTNSDSGSDVTSTVSELPATTPVQVTSSVKTTTVCTSAETTAEETTDEETEYAEIMEVYVPEAVPPVEKNVIEEPIKLDDHPVELETPAKKAEEENKPEIPKTPGAKENKIKPESEKKPAPVAPEKPKK